MQRNDNRNSSSDISGIGIDIGSKTVKLVAVDESGAIAFSAYERHRLDTRNTLIALLHDMTWRHGDVEAPIAVTGSAGIAIAEELDVPFVQEVVATTAAVKSRHPQTDCIIELGGEDAKITYLAEPVEQRMNATCAGGTGDFIDGIARMLGVRTRDFSRLAMGSLTTFDIASRCAVFAQTDVRPLINAGARKADIAQSVLTAVVRQTLGGLACGRPIRGNVVFLGGPLEHIPALVTTFRRALGLTHVTGMKPKNAHLYTAMGAVEAAQDARPARLSELEARLSQSARPEERAEHLPALFESEECRIAFDRAHADCNIASVALEDSIGPLFLGFDAGSTTCKYALVDSEGNLVASGYRGVSGDTFETARTLLVELLRNLEPKPYSKRTYRIARATVTGYGENLVRSAFGFDGGIVETVAHLRAAQWFCPDASFVLDVGGQDMKAFWVRDGAIVDAELNEACSSGCGAFVQSCTRSLHLTHSRFSEEAFRAEHPLDLGSKCTVFMTSRVRHAQKIGAPKSDIAAGIAYSIANNIMTRLIGKSHALPLGGQVVVQGGTFKSDAVLRAFELVSGATAIRPNIAHLMGAYGAAIVAREAYLNSSNETERASSLLSLEEIRSLGVKRSSLRCTGCENGCLLSVLEFADGRQLVSGNRCERAYDTVPGAQAPRVPTTPNVAALEQGLIAKFGDVRSNHNRGRTTIGLMNTMNMYENVPFWHTLLTTLGFSLVVPDDEAARPLREAAAETVPSESVCHPAKLSHLRYAYLERRGCDIIFMPRFERGTRCPVACGYASALNDNVAGAHLASPTVKAIRPEALTKRQADRDTLLEEFNTWVDEPSQISPDEFDHALACALTAQRTFQETLANAARRALDELERDPSARVAIVAGRPYHMDPALLHGIDRELSQLGFMVVPMAALAGQLHALRGKQALWKPAKHLCELVQFAADRPQVEIVVLRSFGCLFDAVSVDEARDLATSLNRPFTALKIDDISDMAHIRIRLRTLAYASSLGHPASDSTTISSKHFPSMAHDMQNVRTPKGLPTPDLCSTAAAILQGALSDIDDDPQLACLHIPEACKDCLIDAVPFEVEHCRGKLLPVEYEHAWKTGAPFEGSGPSVGLIGNPQLVFDRELNEDIVGLVTKLGWRVAYPDPALLEVEDVSYLEQLEAFRRAGVERVIYLQSFGCLKGHIRSRGAARELARLFPDMPITFIDYDRESSALNRENRIRLALS